VSIGSLIAGRYELISRLGGGGMGEVFKALDRLAQTQQDPDPYVAIKILKPELQGNRISVLAMQREAHRARKLTHANIVRVHQLEQDRETGMYFIVMELLEGRSVQSVMEENPNGQPWTQVSSFLAQICAGLECAHQEGIIHSDIKPSNLYLTQRGQIKILDFGIAAPISNLSGDGRATRMDPRKLGAKSPAYASLEMFLKRGAHYSDDVYSLACVTYEWLSGHHPYLRVQEPRAAVTALEALRAELKPAPIPGLTRSQNNALRMALALRRADRTQTISEFWQSITSDPPSLPVGRIAAAAAGALLAGGLLFGILRINHIAASSADDEAWSVAEKVGSTSAFQSYLKQFPHGAHAAAARVILDSNSSKPADSYSQAKSR
jgi:eukaryotic-like serine/threonine-protein kinase